MRVGFIGLGQMGTGMASNVAAAGFQITAWNRNRDRLAPLVALGARAADTPAAAAQGDIVITMLADDGAVESVVFGDGGIADAPALHVSMSTISIALVDRLTAEAPQAFVSAPVFGRPEAAAAAKLFVVAAGPAPLIERCQPVFAAVGQRSFIVGERPAAANIVKLCGNFSIMAMTEAMAEAMTLAERNGVERSLVAEVLSHSLFPGAAYGNYSRMLADNRFVPAGFPARLGFKDMTLVDELATASHTPMPFLSVIHDHFLALLARGEGDIDWAGIARVVRRQAGLD